MVSHRISKPGALHFGHLRISVGLHQSLEVVGDGLRADRAVHALDDEVGVVGPDLVAAAAEVAEHHFA